MRRLIRNSSFWDSTRLFFPRIRGLVHALNDIVINADAWMVSYELELPRFLKSTKDWHLRVAFDRLADPRCRLILPMSDAARQWFLRRVPDDLRETCAKKIHVFTGGLTGPEHYGLCTSPQPRERGQQFQLAFVGNDAFRKGGLYVLDAFDMLRREGIDVKLTFIGRVDPNSYVIPIERNEHDRIIERLRNTKHVTWIPSTSNREVLSTLVHAHVGLLPTLDDSFGWSVIEMMACGTIPIASNVVALPELIRDGVTGRLISIPRDEDNRWVGVRNRGTDAELRSRTAKLLVDGLVNTISKLYVDDSQRMQMACNARNHYEKHYTPEVAARQLERFYDQASEAVGT